MIIALAVLVLVVAAVLVLAATKPDTFVVTRSIRVSAPPDRIRPLVTDFHRWVEWSPFEKLDPGMQKTFSGAASGVGAVYAWNGSGKAGAGRMEITGAATALVTIRLDFSKPFEAHNIAEFSFVPQPDGSTEVTWTMHGPAPFMSKLMQVFMNLDRMIGPDFEEGLTRLKAVAEQAPQ